MIVTFPGVTEQFFIESENINSRFARDYDLEHTPYKIAGDEFKKLVNSKNFVYILGSGTRGMSKIEKWDAFVAENINYPITRTIVFYSIARPKNCTISYGSYVLYGFESESDAAMFKLTFL